MIKLLSFLKNKESKPGLIPRYLPGNALFHGQPYDIYVHLDGVKSEPLYRHVDYVYSADTGLFEWEHDEAIYSRYHWEDVACFIPLFAIMRSPDWRSMRSAPKDGTEIDVLVRGPKGEMTRYIDVSWREPTEFDASPGWFGFNVLSTKKLWGADAPVKWMPNLTKKIAQRIATEGF